MSTSTSTSTAPVCKIDQDILNENSLQDMNDIGLSFFASVCGKNRGAFVLDPPDGNTYGCLQLPTNITNVVGGIIGTKDEPKKDIELQLIDANSIKDQYMDNNITASVALKLLDFLVIRSYESTPNVESNPYGCDVNGLAKLSYDNDDNDGSKSTTTTTTRSPRSDNAPIRSVTLVGLLIPDEPWPTVTTSTKKSGSSRIKYTTKDFQEMVDLGLNTVQISVPTSIFNDLNDDNDNTAELKLLLDSTLDDIQKTNGGLKVILSLVSTTGGGSDDELKSVVLGSVYASSKQNKDIVLGMTIPTQNQDMIIDNTKIIIDSIRAKVGPELSLFIPYTELDLLATSKPYGVIDDPNVYGSLAYVHTKSIGDIASSSSQEDRSKMFYHESIACTMRSPIEYSTYRNDMPLFWSSGFDLSIDNCIQSNDTSNFKDYGQCGRFEESIDSGWWKDHRISFASRQLYSAERGLGWSFASWKLGNDDDNDDETETINEPKQLLSLKDVVNAGLFPDLLTHKTKTVVAVAAQTACLNPPTNDFILGDATLAPTPMPPPDCGNGWWNATTTKCDYWIPPPDPTMSPTMPCPECEECSTGSSVAAFESNNSNTTPSLVMAGIGGAAIVLVLGAIHKYFTRGSRRNEYSPIPN